MREINIGILGFGVVASGVKNVLDENHHIINKRLKRITGKDYSIKIKKILVRDIKKYNNNLQEIMTENIEDILKDKEINIVCELIGGDTIAFDYMRQAMKKNKHLVTANKMAIFNRNRELFKIAKDNNVSFKYEAAVAGAIPIIKLVEEALISDEIEEVLGIFNGSTNYILTKIKKGLDLNEAMELANSRGYLEVDPSSDILGYDSMYKLGILGNLIYGEFPKEQNIERIGIDKIDKSDIEYANKNSKKIKLIGRIKNNNGEISYSIKPELISNESPIYDVDNSLNGILLKCKNAGDIFISGPGAGSRETAISVVSDIISIIREEY